jgi:hypothetical protein
MLIRVGEGGLEMSVDPLGSPSCSITFYYATCRRPYFLRFSLPKNCAQLKAFCLISFFSWLPCVCTIVRSICKRLDLLVEYVAYLYSQLSRVRAPSKDEETK